MKNKKKLKNKDGYKPSARMSCSETLVEALRKLPPSREWFKLTDREKLVFKRARLAEEMSKKMGFILGGTLDQIL